MINLFYEKLLGLYPHAFRERFGESMLQTFNDLYNERKRETQAGLFGFVAWTFIETTMAILREHLQLFSPGDIMQSLLKTLGSSALLSFLLIIPFMVMEVVNRQNFNEDFPGFLFFIMWLNLFAVSLILLPIVLGWRARNAQPANPISARENTRLANPRAAAIVSIALILAPGILPLMEALGWISVDTLVNGPNPEVTYLPGLFIALGLILFPVAAGFIAGRPIARTLRAGGGLLAHRINLLIVGVLLFLFAWGVGSLIVDQWPCFIGVPNCD
jgi:hypothetical protein